MLKIEHSVWLTVMIAVTAAVVVVPTAADDFYTVTDPTRVRLASVGQRYEMQSELYRREHSRMLAREAVQRLPRDTALVTFVQPHDMPVHFERRIRATAMPKMLRLPRRDASMRIVYVLTIDTAASIAGIPAHQRGSGPAWSVDVFPPGTVAPNVCVQVARAHVPWVIAAPSKYSRSTRYVYDYGDGTSGWASEPLGSCWWYAAYGTPGKGVAAWLDTTHYAAVVEPGAIALGDWIRTMSRSQAMGYPRDGAEMTACAAGRDASCSKLFLANATWSGGAPLNTPQWIGRGRDWNDAGGAYNAGGAYSGQLLTRLQLALGPADFERFWKSDAPVPEAFSAVHGGALVDWVRSTVQLRVKDVGDHALPPLPTFASLIAATVLLLYFATRAVSRRSGFA